MARDSTVEPGTGVSDPGEPEPEQEMDPTGQGPVDPVNTVWMRS